MIHRGLDNENKLREFFLEKKHKNLVVQTSIILEMSLPNKAFILDVLYKTGIISEPSGNPPTDAYRHRIQCLGFNGYLLIDLNQLCNKLNIEELEELQHWLVIYREMRQRKGVPIKIEKCDCVKKRKTPNPRCINCGGFGELEVLIEMSDDEILLARGEIDKYLGVQLDNEMD